MIVRRSPGSRRLVLSRLRAHSGQQLNEQAKECQAGGAEVAVSCAGGACDSGPAAPQRFAEVGVKLSRDALIAVRRATAASLERLASISGQRILGNLADKLHDMSGHGRRNAIDAACRPGRSRDPLDPAGELQGLDRAAIVLARDE
jgi:hypothetical protein